MGKDMVPKRIFFTKGVGRHRERLTSFELALRDAGIAAQNLVRVSSIFPPNCKLLARKEGVKYLSPGEVVFAVVAENSTREAHRLLAVHKCDQLRCFGVIFCQQQLTALARVQVGFEFLLQ